MINSRRRRFLTKTLKSFASLLIANEAVYLVGSFSTALDGSTVANAKSWVNVGEVPNPPGNPPPLIICSGPGGSPCGTAGQICKNYCGATCQIYRCE